MRHHHDDNDSALNARERARVCELWSREPRLNPAERRELKALERRMRRGAARARRAS